MIFVDKIVEHPLASIAPMARRYGNAWCHMWTDGNAEELHLFAEKIGLRREYYQTKGLLLHYDLIPSKRILALRFGAKPKSIYATMRELRR